MADAPPPPPPPFPPHPPSLSRESSSSSKSPVPRSRQGSASSESSSRTDRTFVAYQAGTSMGISSAYRKTVRREAAKASAATRKATIARKAAQQLIAASQEGANHGRSPIAPSEDGLGDLTGSHMVESPSRSPRTGVSTPLGSTTGGSYPRPTTSDVVAHYLSHFAPTPPQGHSFVGRGCLRNELWVQAQTEAALFHAVILTTASHIWLTTRLSAALHLATKSKDLALECINDAVARADALGGVSDATVSAIALLGAWELDYGDEHTYDTHMRGLLTIIRLRLSMPTNHAIDPDQLPLCPSARCLVLGAGHDLAMYAHKSRYFAFPSSNMPLSDGNMSSGLASLKRQRLISPSMLHTMSVLANFEIDSESTIENLRRIENTLVDWQYMKHNIVQFSPFRTEIEDRLLENFHAHLRLAALALCGCLEDHLGADANPILHILKEEVPALESRTLTGTSFTEAVFWALFSICCATGQCDNAQMRVLKGYHAALSIDKWDAVKALLTRYIYPGSITESRAMALWEAIDASIVPEDPWPDLKGPVRYAAGIKHPTTDVGLAIAAAQIVDGQ